MLKTSQKFNTCELCGGHLRVIKSRRYETCRLRTYCCDKCKNLKKSREKFQDQEPDQPFGILEYSIISDSWEGVIDED